MHTTKPIFVKRMVVMLSMLFLIGSPQFLFASSSSTSLDLGAMSAREQWEAEQVTAQAQRTGLDFQNCNKLIYDDIGQRWVCNNPVSLPHSIGVNYVLVYSATHDCPLPSVFVYSVGLHGSACRE